ncbi:MAG TPA: lysophospholipid acyltransferase family protein [Ramlibacter sp.]|nr:lysophospholipid acyltransferase family protein [Ramlibacter sp.]
MRVLLALWRVCRVVAHVLAGLCTIVFVFQRLSTAQQQARVQQWAAEMLAALGIRLEVHGAPVASGPALIVANHISWLDILVLHASRYSRFVSKADVRRWPLIGPMATAAGTLYIERESRRDAMRVVHHMADALRAGDVLAVFPEGTTSDGVSLLPFHGNLLQAAIVADVPVQPVALNYLDAATRATARTIVYIDDDTLVGSVWRTLAGPEVTVVVRYGEPQRCSGMDRRVWASGLRDAVSALRQAS